MIRVEHLTKCYGNFLAVDDLSIAQNLALLKKSCLKRYEKSGIVSMARSSVKRSTPTKDEL